MGVMAAVAKPAARQPPMQSRADKRRRVIEWLMGIGLFLNSGTAPGEMHGHQSPSSSVFRPRARRSVRQHTQTLDPGGGCQCQYPLSVSLPCVTFDLSCWHRPSDLTARFSEVAARAGTHMMFEVHGGRAGWFAPFIWHNLAFDPFNLALSAQQSEGCADGSFPRAS